MFFPSYVQGFQILIKSSLGVLCDSGKVWGTSSNNEIIPEVYSTGVAIIHDNDITELYYVQLLCIIGKGEAC